MSLPRRLVPLFLFGVVGTIARPATAAPPPGGAHPRLFMSPANVTAFQKNAANNGSAAAALVKRCKEAIANPADSAVRGGSDGDIWPGNAVACAFAYRVTQDAQYLAPALTYWRAALDDDQNIGDKAGCVSGVSTNWESWDGSGSAPAVILTVTHDTGYSMRWYGPYIALTYDWLYNAAGVAEPLRAQTRTCLGAWVDWYSVQGYHFDEAGSNYNAGFVIAKALAAVAIGSDGGADAHLWNEAGSLLTDLIIGKGLLGTGTRVGTPAGPMTDGDWGEGWQYGPLSVLEYAVATRALEENGLPLPAMHAWTNSLAVRLAHATVPTSDGNWIGGDFDGPEVYTKPNVGVLDAILVGPSSDTAAGWATFMKQNQAPKAGAFFYDALAELRVVAAEDYRTQTPPPSLWYVAHGTRAMYMRTAWDDKALWAVFTSAPHVVSDHQHFSASNFVLTRGADHLIVDPSNYGENATFETNALSADSALTPKDYTSTQTPSSEAELLWARGTSDAVFAARSDLTKAFEFQNQTDIKYAHREWVMLPEGEVITIDRAHTAAAAQAMYVGFHTNTGSGKLALNGSIAMGTVGGSKVAIHTVSLSGGTPQITQPTVGDCKISCNSPCGQCDAARFGTDKYNVKVPGPVAVAVHVIDALAESDAPATVGTLNDDTTDPAPKQNAGVIGAAIERTSKQTYVVASSLEDGASPPTMLYGVPGAVVSRHVVFDAPESTSGKSLVTAAANGARCAITIAPGEGFAGHPLLFSVSSSADGCKVTEATDVAPGSIPAGAGADAGPGAPGAAAAAGADGGCGCCTPRTTSRSWLAGLVLGALAVARVYRRKR